jgi:hypothetical protein
MDAALAADPTAGAAACPEAGVAGAANNANKRKSHRGAFMLPPLMVPSQLSRFCLAGDAGGATASQPYLKGQTHKARWHGAGP